MDRAVLGVDRNDLGSRARPRSLHDGRAGDERLLVRECEPPSRRSAVDRHRKPGEPDDGIQDDVADTASCPSDSAPVRTSVPAGTAARSSSALVSSTIGDHVGWNSSVAWVDERLNRGERCEGKHPEVVGTAADDVKCLCAYRPVEPRMQTSRIGYLRCRREKSDVDGWKHQQHRVDSVEESAVGLGKRFDMSFTRDPLHPGLQQVAAGCDHRDDPPSNIAVPNVSGCTCRRRRQRPRDSTRCPRRTPRPVLPGLMRAARRRRPNLDPMRYAPTSLATTTTIVAAITATPCPWG